MSEESYDRFEDWINEMSDDDYSDWIDNKASEAQKQKALTMREDLSQEELRQMEEQQIYDNRDISARSEINIPETSRDLTVIDKNKTPQKEVIVVTPNQKQPTVILPEDIKPKEKRSFLSRIKSAFSRFRRKKK